MSAREELLEACLDNHGEPLTRNAMVEVYATDLREALNQETIVAAAIRIENLSVTTNKHNGYPAQLIVTSPPPARHHSLMHPIATMIGRCMVGEGSQGFITSTGRYVEREEALQLAIAAGQVDPKNRKSGSSSRSLFSEDLW